MNRGGKLIVAIVVALFLSAGTYYAFFAPRASDHSLTSWDDPTTEIATPGDPTPISPVEPTITATLDPMPSDAVFTGVSRSPLVPEGTPIIAPPMPTPAPIVNPLSVLPTPSPAVLPMPIRPTPVAPTPVPGSRGAAANSGFGEYTVKSGDTLSSIASAWFGSSSKWQKIAAANPSVDPGKLRIGQTLRMPAREMAAGLPNPTPAGRAAAAGVSSDYTVKSGDTLSSIAARTMGKAASWKEIYDANKVAIGSNPAALKIGMKLRIPGKVAMAEPVPALAEPPLAPATPAAVPAVVAGTPVPSPVAPAIIPDGAPIPAINPAVVPEPQGK